MKTVQTLSEINSSPKKPFKNLEIEISNEDDSTDFLAESLVKAEETTPSVRIEEKIIRNDSKTNQKRKKTLSQVGKGCVSRVTPKGKRAKVEFFKDKNSAPRVHSLKSKKRQTLRNAKEEKKESHLDGACVKSFKNLKTKNTDILSSPKAAKLGIGNSKRSLGINDFKDFYKYNMSCRNYKVDFPLKVKENTENDPYVYVTSSEEENA
jgi:hypothetical protein